MGTKIDLIDYTNPLLPITTPIVASAVGSTYSWTITAGIFAPGSAYKIKVSSAICGDCYMDESNAFFSLVSSAPGTFIHVEQPNVGGITWLKGSTYLISWSDNVPGTVKIELWKGGVLHSTLATGVVGSTYLWTILNDGSILSGLDYKIKVISTADAGISDNSDVNFAIAAAGSGGTITVLQPSLPAITWVRGNSYLISWSDNISGTVDIKLFKGGIETATIATNVVGSCYVWPIDILTAIGIDYKIKVISHDDAGTLDESDNDFSIQASAPGTSITVLQPNIGGITWLKGSTYLISWIDNVPGTVKISLYKTGVLHSVVALDVVGTTFLWTIPNDGSVVTGIDYTIRVSSTVDGSIQDFSDNNFAIAATGFGSITVLQPNVGGITWVRGYSYLISWIDNVVGTVDIKLFKGGVDVGTIATNVVGTTYVWPIDILTPTGIDYKIKVISHDDASIADLSDADFAIQATPAGGAIAVLQPNGGEFWYIGNSYLISWDDNFPESVNIDLYEIDEVTLKYSIATNVVGSTYVWNTTGHLPALGGNYKVKISSTLVPALCDFSNAAFSLNCLPLISVYPNPADFYLTVKFDESSTENFTLSLTDRFNMQVYERNIDSEGMKELRISTADLPNGVYFLTITSGKSVETKKVIVQH